MEEQRSATPGPRRDRSLPKAPDSRAPRPRFSWQRLARIPRRLRDRMGSFAVWAVLVIAALVIVAVVVTIITVTIIAIATVSRRIPSALAAHWPMYLLVMSPFLMHVFSKAFCGGRRRDGDAARPHLAPDWLRRRLLALNKPTATVIVAPTPWRRSRPLYRRERPVLLVSKDCARARGAAAYAQVASALARLLLLEDHRARRPLAYLTAAAHSTDAFACGLLVGAVLVGVPTLRTVALALLVFTALAQLVGTGFEIVVARRAAHELSADPELAGPGAELAVHQLRSEVRRHIALAITRLTVAALAAPVTAATLAAAGSPLAALVAAPPLAGTELWLVKLAALSYLVIGTLYLVSRHHALLFLAFLIACTTGLCASPTLAVLTWDQGFAVAHPWALALAVGAAWPAFALFLAIPVFVVALTMMLPFRKRMIAPDRFLLPEPVLPPAERLRLLRAPPVGPAPALLHHALVVVWEAVGVMRAAPLAYLALRALW